MARTKTERQRVKMTASVEAEKKKRVKSTFISVCACVKWTALSAVMNVLVQSERAVYVQPNWLQLSISLLTRKLLCYTHSLHAHTHRVTNIEDFHRMS